jgi:hypothetical protein
MTSPEVKATNVFILRIFHSMPLRFGDPLSFAENTGYVVGNI